MIRQPERLKDVANRLADLFTSPQGSEVFRLIKQLAREGSPTSSDRYSDAAKRVDLIPVSQPTMVGVWEKRIKNNETLFVRTQVPDEPSSFWARTGCIYPKGRRQRVVLLGESVARGFFYDPSFNPAGALHAILNGAVGDDEIEVIDLARTNLLLDQLQNLAHAALALEPDVLVVLAGNNWGTMSVLPPHHLRDLADLIRKGGWRLVKEYLEALLCERARQCLQTFGSIVQNHGIPVVLAIPEFNLLDWRDEFMVPPLADSQSVAEWLHLYSDANCALLAGELGRAESLALRMIKLDGGTTPCGPSIIAESKLRWGLSVEARKFLEMARDATICSPRFESPRCFSITQRTMRAEAEAYGIAVVDLPRKFEEYLSGGLPGRRLFLDYCHFTVEAARVAMAAITEVLLPCLNRPQRSWSDLAQTHIEVSPKVISEAHFLAAVHNANWGQGADIIRYHCRKAIEHSADITRMITLFLDFHVRRTPSCLCKAFDEMCQLWSLSALNILFDQANPLEEKFPNHLLIGELIAALQPQHPKLKESTERVLYKEHGVESREIDLIQKAYSLKSRVVPMDHDQNIYYRALQPVSQFRLICGKCLPVRLNLTYRVKNSDPSQKIIITVNDVFIGTASASSNWKVKSFIVPAQVLRLGFNFINIQWPLGDWCLPEWANQVAEKLEAEMAPNVNPIFGEIHTLRAASVLTDVSLSQDFSNLAR